MDSNRIRITGGTFLAIASLLIGFFSTSVASAYEGSTFYLEESGEITIVPRNVDINYNPNSNIRFGLWKYQYPTTGANFAGAYQPANYNFVASFICVANVSSCVVEGDTLSLDLEDLASGDGTYWLEYSAQQGSNYNGDVFYNLVRNGGVWTSENAQLPLTLSASPWVRMTSPVNNSQHTASVNFTIQANAGTTTADTIEVRFLSNFQSIPPKTFEINTSGLQTENFVINFPQIDDVVQIQASLLLATTTIVTSQTYSIRIGDAIIGQPDIQDTQNCDDTSGIGWAICTTVVFLFYPSEGAINNFTNLYDTLSTKFPFAYFTDFNDSIGSVFTGATTASLAITVPFGTYGEIDLISAEQIEAVPFTSLIRTLLGALIWIMLGLTIYRRTQKIFNKEHTT